MSCSVCHQGEETRYIDLYVFGSEGLQLCRPCENEISKIIMDLSFEKQRQRKEKYLATKAAYNKSLEPR